MGRELSFRHFVSFELKVKFFAILKTVNTTNFSVQKSALLDIAYCIEMLIVVALF